MFSNKKTIEFLDSKIQCAISQIRARRIKISTSSYGIVPDRNKGIWVYGGHNIHPLAFFIENQKILFDVNTLHAISRKFNCIPESIVFFNKGLCGSKINFEKEFEQKDFYDLGLKTRMSLIPKKEKR